MTWYSRLGAIIVFLLVLPTISFYIGTQYELTVRTISQVDSYGAQQVQLEAVRSR